MKNDKLKPLKVTFFISGIWDLIAGVMYLFFIGTGRMIDDPSTHSFYSVFLASFFLCFAYIQFVSAKNLQNYTFLVGCLIFGRLFYVFQLYGYILFSLGFPTTFWFTGIIDACFILLYLIFAKKSELKLVSLFFPRFENAREEFHN
jgi:hypothetical protein